MEHASDSAEVHSNGLPRTVGFRTGGEVSDGQRQRLVPLPELATVKPLSYPIGWQSSHGIPKLAGRPQPRTAHHRRWLQLRLKNLFGGNYQLTARRRSQTEIQLISFGAMLPGGEGVGNQRLYIRPNRITGFGTAVQYFSAIHSCC